MVTNPARLHSGRFSLPEAPGHRVGGWLDVASGWPLVTLADPLTPAMRVSQGTTGPEGELTITPVPADDDIDPGTFTVHGLAALQPASHHPRRHDPPDATWCWVVRDPTRGSSYCAPVTHFSAAM